MVAVVELRETELQKEGFKHPKLNKNLKHSYKPIFQNSKNKIIYKNDLDNILDAMERNEIALIDTRTIQNKIITENKTNQQSKGNLNGSPINHLRQLNVIQNGIKAINQYRKIVRELNTMIYIAAWFSILFILVFLMEE